MMNMYQRGFTLPIAMILLVLVSLGVAYALRVSLLAERISSNEGELAIARESAELALRDAKNDILGLDYKGAICTVAVCIKSRPSGSRPTSLSDTLLWEDASIFMPKAGQDVVPGISSPGNDNYGVYNSRKAVLACLGAAPTKSLWDVADWGGFQTSSSCSVGTGRVKTVPYGTYTGALFPSMYGSKKPQYLMEIISGADLNVGSSAKVFVRITAVGFTRSGSAHVALQELYAPF